MSNQLTTADIGNKFNLTVGWFMMLAKHWANQTDGEDIEDVISRAVQVIEEFENNKEYEHIGYFGEFIELVNPLYKGFVGYLDGYTLWIVDEKNNVAYETRQYRDGVPANGIFITHNMSDWHATSLLELKDSSKIVTVPDWAMKIIE